jgi:hypothetical protein
MDPGTFVLACATAVLAVATVWLALEQRQGRIEAGDARARVALRAALGEQLENARRWHSSDPSRGAEVLQALRSAGPEFEATTRLLSEVDLPAELAAYLLWLVGDTRRAWDTFRALLNRIAPADGSVPTVHPSNSTAQDDWGLILERLQVAACLVAAEASRRGYGVDGAIVDHVRWALPRVWPERMRVGTQVSESTYLRISAKAISPSGVFDHPRSEAAERPTRGSGSLPDHHLLSMGCGQSGMARLARTGGRMQVSGVGMTHQRASWGV